MIRYQLTAFSDNYLSKIGKIVSSSKVMVNLA